MLSLKKVLLWRCSTIYKDKFFAEQPVFVTEFLGQMDFCRRKANELAEAIPDEILNPGTGDGVRSVVKFIFTCFWELHLGNDVWWQGSRNVGFVSDPAKMGEWDTTTNKAEIAIMKRSFDVLKKPQKHFHKMTDNKEISFRDEVFFAELSCNRNCSLSRASGQSIAYARMNGVTPPWSKSGE
jgi:hypothetical protein